MDPAERRLRTHLEQVPFLIGAVDGLWGIVADSDLKWPIAAFWVLAAPRNGAPDRYYIRLDLTNYPIDPATGTFWDPVRREVLSVALRPFGLGQVARVFRVDWKGGQAFYHPYDRQASRDGHSDWPRQYPHWVWTENHSVSDLLSVVSDLLNSTAYEGVRGNR